MTENKQFTRKEYAIYEKGNPICMTLRDVDIRLNELWEENEQLKSKNRGLQSELQIFKEDVTHSNLQINKLADENEQLKKELSKKMEECRRRGFE